jgi:hypothetical protein
MPFPPGRHPVEDDIFTRKVLDPHSGSTPEPKGAKVMGDGYRLHPWSDAISPSAHFRASVGLSGERVVRRGGYRETVLILRRDLADGRTGSEGKDRQKKDQCRESAEPRDGRSRARYVPLSCFALMAHLRYLHRYSIGLQLVMR